MVGYNFKSMASSETTTTMMKMRKNPEWLEKLLEIKFFRSCSDHEQVRKNEMNVFCIDCRRSICQHCASSSPHSDHEQLQIRRYVYRDVIRVSDIHKLVDCSSVQPYTINSAKVVFLNTRHRGQSKTSSGGSSCRNCDKHLTEPNSRFCSIECKIEQGKKEKEGEWNSSELPALSDIMSIMDTILNGEDAPQPDSDSPESSNSGEWPSYTSLKPKKQLHKRKGVPRRAPLC